MLASIFNAMSKVAVVAAVAKDNAMAASTTMGVRVAAEYASAKVRMEAAIDEAKAAKKERYNTLIAQYPQCFAGMTKDSTDKELKAMFFAAEKLDYIANKVVKAEVVTEQYDRDDIMDRVAKACPYTHK